MQSQGRLHLGGDLHPLFSLLLLRLSNPHDPSWWAPVSSPSSHFSVRFVPRVLKLENDGHECTHTNRNYHTPCVIWSVNMCIISYLIRSPPFPCIESPRLIILLYVLNECRLWNEIHRLINTCD